MPSDVTCHPPPHLPALAPVQGMCCQLACLRVGGSQRSTHASSHDGEQALYADGHPHSCDVFAAEHAHQAIVSAQGPCSQPGYPCMAQGGETADQALRSGRRTDWNRLENCSQSCWESSPSSTKMAWLAGAKLSCLMQAL